jgi:glucose/arabinose dehydrogenase
MKRLGFTLAVLAVPVLAVEIDPSAIKVPDGYRVEAFVTGLSVPTTAIFDGNDLIVAESGYAKTALPRILRIKPDGSVEQIASAGLEPPVTGLAKVGDKLFVSHSGKVSTLGPDGALSDVVTGLPSKGDHHNNNIVPGPDGKLYMGQGTVTNAAVVGIDNYVFGWLPKNPELREVPCRDITLVGENFETDNPLTAEDDKVRTGAYKPFGTASQPGEVIAGNPKCGGSIVRFNPDGSGFELVAWGLRNPFGLEFDAKGQLWSTFHGADVRGSRNINDDPDYLVNVKPNAWYGWPEFFAGEPVTASRFNAAGKPQPKFLWTTHPPLTRPFMVFDSHSGTNGMAFSPGGNFGFAGEAFIAMFGTFAPITTGLNFRPVGFAVMRVDMNQARTYEFATNRLAGPAYLNRQGGFNRPSDVVFGPDTSLYVVDWGGATVSEKGLELQPATGVVWRIFRDGMSPARSQPIRVQPAAFPKEAREPMAKNVPQAYKMLWPQLLVIGLVVVGIIILIVWLIRRVKKRS